MAPLFFGLLDLTADAAGLSGLGGCVAGDSAPELDGSPGGVVATSSFRGVSVLEGAGFVFLWGFAAEVAAAFTSALLAVLEVFLRRWLAPGVGVAVGRGVAFGRRPKRRSKNPRFSGEGVFKGVAVGIVLETGRVARRGEGVAGRMAAELCASSTAGALAVVASS